MTKKLSYKIEEDKKTGKQTLVITNPPPPPTQKIKSATGSSLLGTKSQFGSSDPAVYSDAIVLPNAYGDEIRINPVARDKLMNSNWSKNDWEKLHKTMRAWTAPVEKPTQ